MNWSNPAAIFIMGATASATFAVGAFFAHYWRKTKDRFFLLFAAAFWLMTANRIVLFWMGDASEHQELAYISRLVAFLLIIFAIVDKNRAAKA